jgi:F-type H+-transporting ATPase subunit epsilon
VADGRRTFSVSVVTPTGPAFEGEAEMLIVPGADGEIGILARHAPLVAMLRAGATRIHPPGGEVLELATGAGFFEVADDRAIALVDDALERAQAQLERARAELARVERGESDADRWQLEQEIRHAEIQLEVAER